MPPSIVAIILASLDVLPPLVWEGRSRLRAAALRAIIKFDDGTMWDGECYKNFRSS
jgi:hypothetical protein